MSPGIDEIGDILPGKSAGGGDQAGLLGKRHAWNVAWVRALGDVGQAENLALAAFEKRNCQPRFPVDAVDLFALAQIAQRLGGVFGGDAIGDAGAGATPV